MESQDENLMETQIEAFDPEKLEMEHLRTLARNPAFRVFYFEVAEMMKQAINGLCSEENTQNIYRFQGMIESYQRVLAYVPTLEQELKERKEE